MHISYLNVSFVLWEVGYEYTPEVHLLCQFCVVVRRFVFWRKYVLLGQTCHCTNALLSVCVSRGKWEILPVVSPFVIVLRKTCLVSLVRSLRYIH